MTIALMLRGAVAAALLSVVLHAAAFQAQAPGVLHIRIVLVDAERKPMPVPRHALLISDNPATATPRRVVTGPDGTADVRLPPANYTVESDEPVAFQGKAYQWTQTIDIVAGRDMVLELTADNAEVGPAGSAPGIAPRPLEADPLLILAPLQNSVVGLWTPTTYASGFVIDANGLIATNQHAVGAATSIEVQLTPDVKVVGNVVVADAARDVAVLRIDPAAAASIRPVPLGCAQEAAPSVAAGDEIFALEAPMRQQARTIAGRVRRVEAREVVSDLMLASGGSGGPVFTAGGRVVGITSSADDSSQRRGNSRLVGIGDVCAVVTSAAQKMKDVSPPSGAHLPVEPARPFPVEALKDAAQRRAGSLMPYQASSSGFDIAFITPQLTYGVQYRAEQTGRRQRSGGAPSFGADQALARPLEDFGNWSEYVDDFPPVLLVRVTPKLVEGFWTKVARGAAQTQGMSIPSIKRFKSGFLRMRAFCGDAEVTPIHPFKLEHRISDSDAIYEGLYVFDAAALGPSCANVRLVVYSEKEPEKADAAIVDPKVIQQIWQDFAPFRPLSQ
jgi:S1-C subfamily serine protease